MILKYKIWYLIIIKIYIILKYKIWYLILTKIYNIKI